MTRGLIDYLTYTYRFIHKGSGILKAPDLQAIGVGASVMVRTAPGILPQDTDLEEVSRTMQEAQLIDHHIEESIAWLLTLENV